MTYGGSTLTVGDLLEDCHMDEYGGVILNQTNHTT